MTKLLPMRQQDIEKWSNDPEEWLNEEDSERWEYELRVSGNGYQSHVIAHADKFSCHCSRAQRNSCKSSYPTSRRS